MAELDFSKIFGETATSKAEFTNENYLKGWGYLGSTPPPYQLFDYLQSQNDQKLKWLYDRIVAMDNRYVPRTGGTMSGNLIVKNGTEFSAVELDNTTNGKLLIESMGHNSDNVGHIIYRNGADTQAKLNIPKKTGTLATLADVPAPVDLDIHNADVMAHSIITAAIAGIIGSDNWQDSPAATIKEITDKLGFGGVVAQRIEESGYVQYANSVCFQWSRRKSLQVYDNYRYEETFPKNFEKECFGVLLTLEGRGAISGLSGAYTDNRTTTGFTIVTDASSALATTDLFYLAVGW